MDVEAFHLKLLGRDQDQTPECLRLTDEVRHLYRAYTTNDVRGYLGPPCDEWTVATIVLGLSMTWTDEGPRPVVLVVPRPAYDHTTLWLNVVARHIFRQRKGQVEAVKILREAWKQLVMPRFPVGLPEPPHWVAFGYDTDTVGPPWIAGRLVQSDA